MVQTLHKLEMQILLNTEQRQALEKIAAREGRSISDVASEMIMQELEQRQQVDAARLEQRLAVLERIRRHREEILAERGGEPYDFDVVEVINQMRTERDERNLGLRSDCD